MQLVYNHFLTSKPITDVATPVLVSCDRYLEAGFLLKVTDINHVLRDGTTIKNIFNYPHLLFLSTEVSLALLYFYETAPQLLNSTQVWARH
jgi:hypothetical protein